MTPLLVPLTRDLVARVAETIRPVDRDAILAMGHETVEAGLLHSLDLSAATWALVEERGPIAVAGVTADDQLWLACTLLLADRPIAMWRAARQVVDQVLQGRRSVWSVCDERDGDALRFLERLGFATVDHFTVNKTRARFVLMGRLSRGPLAATGTT